MQIKKIISQHRRDFEAVYECEHCGHTEKDYGYDDAYFHETVIPEKACEECKKTADHTSRTFATKYPEGTVV